VTVVTFGVAILGVEVELGSEGLVSSSEEMEEGVPGRRGGVELLGNGGGGGPPKLGSGGGGGPPPPTTVGAFDCNY